MNSAVVWSWVFNGLRVGTALLLLPLLLRLLPTEELGFYYLFVSIFAFVTLMDFGLLSGIDRFVVYAMGGATEFKPFGMAAPVGQQTGPNYPLIWKLLFVTRRLYLFLTLALVVILGSVGTILVQLRISETQNPSHTWLAWGLTLVSTAVELYSGWWNVFLRGMNQVLWMSRIYVMAYAIRLVLSCLLLLAGGGLLSVPIATILSGLALRYVARRYCLSVLAPYASAPPSSSEVRDLLRTAWPNSWRAGLLSLGGYLSTSANGLICVSVLGLAANAQYGLSVQLIYFMQSLAMTWMWVKWPLIGQYRARQDHVSLRRLFWRRLHLQALTFLVTIALAIPSAPFLLDLLNTNKTILPTFWLILLAINALFEMHLASWNTLIATTNYVPFVWPVIASNILSFVLALVLVHVTPLGIGALIIAPLLSGSLLNYWYWPTQGAKTLQTGWRRFVFSRPA
jgi:hypothetical protein